MRIVVLVLALVIAASASAGSPAELARIYASADGVAYVVDTTGRERRIPAEPGQVGVSEARLSSDHRTAGWLVEEANCCTSYPIPLRLALYRNSRRVTVGDGFMIFDWAFADSGRRVAVSTGTVHGASAVHVGLYDASTGHRLSQWTGSGLEQAPAWATGLRR